MIPICRIGKVIVIRNLILGVVLCCSVVNVSYGWNGAGHMTVARIAWDTLSASEREAVVAILRSHPHVDVLLRKDRPEAASDAEWIFLRASIWSDDIRPPKSLAPEEIPIHPIHKFHRGNWHYVNYMYQMGQRGSELPDEPLPNSTNILNELEHSMQVLKNPDSADEGRVPGISALENRAVRMAWLFHLAGDLHQPLHAASLVDTRLFPDLPNNSDQGGNKLAILVDENSMPKNLHWIWDEMFSTESQFEQVCQHSERLTHDPAYSIGNLIELKQQADFKQWAAESYAAAKKYAYLDGKLKPVLWDDVTLNKVPVSSVPVLSYDELQQGRQIAQRRIVVAGHRLASKLKEVVGSKN